ncbi:hypothetical protein CQ010_01450 [Arthrobacter sp. MYb211]|uniref:hypothetical protein n=1 Tax=unclassified Arthrobacter TaxID=235627 RepID=UPI000CFA8575|nr:MULTISPECIES: hypothetical protein [unclassified Arthrobacter]PRA13340.1 hypothetical protein CQ015_03705 [Arthrobacter sp. MYb221]PRC10537.1 hypothetical protein CQ010_01450 [Arthrobacter sp. MYb211]
MSTATEARTKLKAKIDSRDLDQITTELTLLSKQEYTAAVALVTSLYIRSLDERYSTISELTWAYIEKLEAQDPEKYMSYADALLIVRSETGL